MTLHRLMTMVFALLAMGLATACGGGTSKDDAKEQEAASDNQEIDLAEASDPEAIDDAPADDNGGEGEPDANDTDAADPDLADPDAETAPDPSDASDGTDEDAGEVTCTGTIGGVCTDARWVLCPTGLEPYDPHPHADCEMNGWCCVDAPPSDCSDSSSYNCVVGTACDDTSGEWGRCWATPSQHHDCEVGRVCCMDICG